MGRDKWKTQDGCSIYLDIEHARGESTAIQYNIYGEGSPLFETASPKVATWSCQRSGTLHQYEWRFDVGRISRSQFELKPGRVLGLDISICDKDQDASFSWASWGPGTRKAGNSARLGDILLLSADDDTGKVRGRLLTATGVEPLRYRTAIKLHRQTQTSPVTVITNSSGEFEVELPVGKYFAGTMASDRVQRFRVEAGGETRLGFPIASAPATATRKRAGPGTTVTAGYGKRFGALHRYGTEDGLPVEEVRQIAQAKDGSLWFAGPAGLSRFDGRSMTTFNERDGLTPDSGRAVAVDHIGNIWVGTDEGLHRYDGKSFVRFTLGGMPSGTVNQVLPEFIIRRDNRRSISTSAKGRLLRRVGEPNRISSSICQPVCQLNSSFRIGVSR